MMFDVLHYCWNMEYGVNIFGDDCKQSHSYCAILRFNREEGTILPLSALEDVLKAYPLAMRSSIKCAVISYPPRWKTTCAQDNGCPGVCIQGQVLWCV